MVFPGADDNASGVATVLEVAKMVSSGHFMFRRSVIFAFFGSNELGMAGS
jgi:Zn-dependent M28 family amino/carboxypeptidase